MIKSKFLIETNDLNGDLLLCNLLYKTKMKIKKEDKNTIDVYFGNEKIDYNEKLKMFIDNGIFIEETTDEIELVKKAKEIGLKSIWFWYIRHTIKNIF